MVNKGILQCSQKTLGWHGNRLHQKGQCPLWCACWEDLCWRVEGAEKRGLAAEAGGSLWCVRVIVGGGGQDCVCGSVY